MRTGVDKIEVLGYSVKRRPIEGFWFKEQTDKQLDTLFIGAIHGDEGLSAELLQQWITALNKKQFAGHPVSVKEHPLLIIPVLNPDGYALGTRVNSNKVDLNRNYPTENWNGEGAGSIYYQGTSAGSEPETQLMINLIEAWKPRKIVTIHTPYKVVNYDGPAKPLAEAMAAQCGYAAVESIGYPTPGSFGTYFGTERGIPVITLELDEAVPLASLWKTHQRVLETAALF